MHFGLRVFHRHTNETDCHRWCFSVYNLFSVLQAWGHLICVQPESRSAWASWLRTKGSWVWFGVQGLQGSLPGSPLHSGSLEPFQVCFNVTPGGAPGTKPSSLVSLGPGRKQLETAMVLVNPNRAFHLNHKESRPVVSQHVMSILLTTVKKKLTKVKHWKALHDVIFKHTTGRENTIINPHFLLPTIVNILPILVLLSHPIFLICWSIWK